MILDTSTHASRSAGIRPFVKTDAPAVAEIYRKVFLKDAAAARQPMTTESIAASFTEAFLENPWYSEDLSSLVYESKSGEVVGFMGVTARRMNYKGRRIRVAVSAHHMILPGCREPLAGLQLIKRFFAGPQDLSFTDAATQAGRKVWEGAGGHTHPAQSIRWVRALRPASHVLDRGARGFKPMAAMKSLAGVGDRLLAKRFIERFGVAASDLEERPLDTAMLRAAIDEFSSHASLRPEYDEQSLAWLLYRAAHLPHQGELQQVALFDGRKKLTGWYLYYLNPGGLSQVLQVGARKETAGQVLDSLFHHAWRGGATAVTGRMAPALMQAATEKHCEYKFGEPWALIHSRHPEIAHSILLGDAFLTTLEGERCTSFRTAQP